MILWIFFTDVSLALDAAALLASTLSGRTAVARLQLEWEKEAEEDVSEVEEARRELGRVWRSMQEED